MKKERWTKKMIKRERERETKRKRERKAAAACAVIVCNDVSFASELPKLIETSALLPQMLDGMEDVWNVKSTYQSALKRR